MTDWTTFAGFVGVVLTLLLVLAHASKGHLSPPELTAGDRTRQADESAPPSDGETAVPTSDETMGPTSDEATTRERVDRPVASEQLGRGVADLSSSTLLANVAVSQGLFAGLLVVGAWVTEVPPVALGLVEPTPSRLAVAVGLGVALYGVNEAGSAASERLGFGGEEALREALAPDSPRGWLLLLFVVLPVIAGFEELLFRGALVGALSVGFGVSPWLLVVLSSVAFAAGHGAQGPGGIAVTGALGVALAVAFVLTGSLAVVFVAHYLVNALAFVVHEGFDVDTLW